MKTRNFVVKTTIIIFLSIFIASCDQLLIPVESSAIDGTWKCVEQHEEEGQTNYTVEIEYDESDSSKIYINNFLNLDTDVIARVSGSSISIARQNVGNHIVAGSGTINSDYSQIQLQFTDDIYGGSPWNVSATYTKY